MDMNIQKYMAFIETVEYSSFTKAAEVLNYSQSGISRMIDDLEKEWRVSLLERGRAGVRLTSDGLKLLPFVQNVCSEYRKLQSQVDELNGLQSGLIRIGTFSSVATHWLPNIIKAFQKDYPNIDYELLLGDYTEIESWILEGRVDCGFLRLPTLPEFEKIFLEQDKLLAVLPENHPLADCERFPVKALCDYPFMLLEKGVKAEISEIFKKCGIEPQIRFTTWDDYAIMSMVEGGLGVSILPELILRRIPYQIVAKEL
ncbi:MAG: LysR family transcriptional regulator, partial [Synergistaceae bacterium]|nr:LysR family transcriptional regulator [Synergistaceae bacterium]